jgi:hypothetical protein
MWPPSQKIVTRTWIGFFHDSSKEIRLVRGQSRNRVLLNWNLKTGKPAGFQELTLIEGFLPG